jgi:prepilin-type N-terminal cleavage/methylation domain-containing protein
MQRKSGFTLIEVMIAMALSLVLMIGLLAAYSHATAVKNRIQGTVKIQDNVRLTMDKLARDLRMTGFGVPEGARIGGTAVWTPVVFYAAQTQIGYRADIDGGSAEIVCTPNSSNSDCPLNKLRLDSIRYFQDRSCNAPDGSAMRLVASVDRKRWEPVTCNGYNVGDSAILVSSVTNATFRAGESQAATIEQVYYRYLPGSQPPYGTLVRYVRYDNTPDVTFPPTGVTWTTVADHLTDFWLEYQDRHGTTLSSFPLSTADLWRVHKIIVFVEGYDQIGPQGQPQLVQARSEILLRNH